MPNVINRKCPECGYETPVALDKAPETHKCEPVFYTMISLGLFGVVFNIPHKKINKTPAKEMSNE